MHLLSRGTQREVRYSQLDTARAIVSADMLADWLDDADLRVVDTRFSLADPGAGRHAYASCHVPGAVYADLDRNLSGPVSPATGRHPLPEAAAFAEWLARAGIGNSHRIVAYDNAGGAIAARLWWLLRWLGHRQVAILDGGYTAWTGAGYPVSVDPPGRDPAHFVPNPDPRMVVTTDQVQTQVLAGDMLLVDAREPERFRGEAEPIDRVAGRVPGAVNFPFRDNLTTAGRLLGPGELRSRWASILQATSPADVACMCGSGVTACLDLLALEIAGFEGARLYAGSWSEWIIDPARPVATGPD